jgi:hypothetical protein
LLTASLLLQTSSRCSRRAEKTITLGGDLRPHEARAFAAAALGGGTPAAETLGALALFVSDPNSLNQLVKQSQPLILVLTDFAVAQGMPLQHPHQVVLLARPGSEACIDVTPVDGRVVASILEDSGLPREQAVSLGQLARRSLLALRRSLAVTPTLLMPSWSVSPDIVRRRLLLLGPARTRQAVHGNPQPGSRRVLPLSN